MARPKKEINQEEFEKLCALQCTKEEILEWFRVSEPTLDGWCKRTFGTNFLSVFKQKRKYGKISLRRMGWRLAEKNAAVWIFLAKNHLGMKDNPDADDTMDKLNIEIITKTFVEQIKNIPLVDKDGNKIDEPETI